MFSGYLNRSSKGKLRAKSKRLFYVLKADSLISQKSESQTDMIDGMNLKKISVRQLPGVPPGASKKYEDCGFEITTERDEAVILFAETKQSASQWIEAIQRQQTKLKPGSVRPAQPMRQAESLPIPATASPAATEKPTPVPSSPQSSSPTPAVKDCAKEVAKEVAKEPQQPDPTPRPVVRQLSHDALREVFDDESVLSEDEDVYEESDSQYDCVCCIDSIEQVCWTDGHMNAGWKMKFAPGMEQRFATGNEKWSSSVVAVLGLYNKGKTYVLNNLASVSLDSGTTVHTEGLSFKLIKNKKVNHILLDTAGLHSPVYVQDDRPEKALAVKKATEFFLEDLTFLLADFYVVVVNDLTSLDQEYIQKLILKLKHDTEKVQQLYVIHNFKDSRTTENLLALWKEQVVDIYTGGQMERTLIAATDPKTDQLVRKEVEWLNTQHTRHVFVANNESDVGKERNTWVFALVKMWLGSRFIPVKRVYSPVDHLLDYSNKMIQFYVENSLRLIYDREKKVVRMQDPTGDRVPALKPATIDVNGFCFVDVDYVPRVDSYMDDKGLHICMDVPGLTGNYKITKVGWDSIKVVGVREKPYGDVGYLDKAERKYGAFKKEFKIPPGFQIRGAKHGYEDGVISIFLARSQVEEEL